ncbi:hypothetical protein D3C76_1072150 [compost metagenome]
MFAQIAEILRVPQDQLTVAAVGAGKVAGHGFADKRIATAQFRRVVIAVAADITAGQDRAFGPRRADTLIERCQFFHRMLSQLAIGGELAAKHRQQRRLAVVIVNIEGVVAGDGLR